MLSNAHPATVKGDIDETAIIAVIGESPIHKVNLKNVGGYVVRRWSRDSEVIRKI